MNILITGVNGQDGSYLAELLCAKGHKVFGMIRRSSSANLWRLEKVINRENFHLIEGDVTDLSSVLHCFTVAQPDHVYNMAAQSHVKTSFSQPKYTTDVVYGGVLNILEAIRLFQLNDNSSIRMYQASSSEMFGSNYSLRRPDSQTVEIDVDGSAIVLDLSVMVRHPSSEKVQNEKTPFSPCSPYGVAKLAAHQLCEVYRKGYDIDVRCGILNNHESHRRGSKFVTKKIVEHIGKHHNKLIFPTLELGNIDTYRDFGHAEDYMLAAIEYMNLNKESAPPALVIGTGETHSIRDFLAKCFAFVDKDYDYYVSTMNQEHLRPYEVEYLRADCSLANSLLDWKPKHNISTLVEEMVTHEIQRNK